MYGDRVDEVFSRTSAGGTAAWYLTDRLGSVRGMTDGTGAAQVTVVYDGFGVVTSNSNSSFTDRYTFTGREYDAALGMQFNRTRWDAPVTGSWVTQDPSQFGGGDYNLYRYVGNDATNKTDSTGLASTWPEYLGEVAASWAAWWVTPTTPPPPAAPPVQVNPPPVVQRVPKVTRSILVTAPNQPGIPDNAKDLPWGLIQGDAQLGAPGPWKDFQNHGDFGYTMWVLFIGENLDLVTPERIAAATVMYGNKPVPQLQYGAGFQDNPVPGLEDNASADPPGPQEIQRDPKGKWLIVADSPGSWRFPGPYPYDFRANYGIHLLQPNGGSLKEVYYDVLIHANGPGKGMVTTCDCIPRGGFD
jgi:RHS repeat-associated protein